MYTTFGGMYAEIELPSFYSATVEVSFTIDAAWTVGAWTGSDFVAIGFNTTAGDRHFPGVTFTNHGTAHGDDDNGNSVTGLPVMQAGVPYIMQVQWDASGIQFQVNNGGWNRFPGPLAGESYPAGGAISPFTAAVAIWTGGGGDIVGTVDYVDINGESEPTDTPAEFWTDFQAAKEVV